MQPGRRHMGEQQRSVVPQPVRPCRRRDRLNEKPQRARPREHEPHTPHENRRTSVAGPVTQRIVLTRLRQTDDWLLEELAPMLQEVFEADSSVTDPIALPEDAYNASRRQA